MAFFAWLVLEDLVRKLAGNDIAIYFIKDAFYVVLLAAMVLDPAVRGSWRSATGSTRIVLYLMLGWAVVMSIRPPRPAAAIACSAFITMLRKTWCSSSGSLSTRGSFSS